MFFKPENERQLKGGSKQEKNGLYGNGYDTFTMKRSTRINNNAQIHYN